MNEWFSRSSLSGQHPFGVSGLPKLHPLISLFEYFHSVCSRFRALYAREERTQGAASGASIPLESCVSSSVCCPLERLVVAKCPVT